MDRLRRTGFVSYAQEDAVLVGRFLKLLLPRLVTQRAFEIELWTDQAILAGEDWAQEIDGELRTADFGLLCVSASFLASCYITDVELPALLDPVRVVIPVALEPLDFSGGDLKGLEDRQVFRYRPEGPARLLSFEECGGVNRKHFCDELVAQTVARLRGAA